MRRFVFDMETGDPDDFLTLALLGGHPEVELVAVAVTPGTPHQIGVVRYALARLGLDIPVGAHDIDHRKARGTPEERYVSCVSSWHYRTFGDIAASRDAEAGAEVLERALDASTTLVTGGPLKNLGALLARGGDRGLGPLFIQGGFAGDGVVPPEKQLDKFRGMTTCPTYNLNGDVRSALAVLASERFADRRLVSKNVCHGVVYDRSLHRRLTAIADPHPGLELIAEGMAAYLERSPEGKKLHDPLAACCAIDPDIAEWAEVEVYREKGKWGARPAPGSGTRIIVDVDRERFVDVLTASAPTVAQ